MFQESFKFTAYLAFPEAKKMAYPKIFVPGHIANPLLKGKSKCRIVLTLKNGMKFHRAIQKLKNGEVFISIGKSILNEAKLKLGQEVEVVITKDTSDFGYTFPEELKELLLQDAEGEKAFLALKPGKQRSFLYYISSAKSVDVRIKRSIDLIENLKMGIIAAKRV